ncbi:Aste57867_6312 [Aphanomyces stellatus]|uniref:Aste57867_6311 protein n=1 Tax=Aphanomyces stellatus TaxID=120398 RepID=A0A485KGF4_9STRA|nr:hypothetical protein As57867_006297 [Aphanomyces stellatus]KAF0708540.1 hypothetical protein As57867_006298 [Aphanomyces stellatus]VFT83309.1 Aste57867_6311 [Aphanomyces stellatus]VFT83310.1 Aste57867_6312 [Aphanomyces stellatus]
MQAKAGDGLLLQERLSFLSNDRAKEAHDDANYVDGKTPNDLEDGALRLGGAPEYTSPEVLAILGQYFCVGIMYGALPQLPYTVLTQYFHLSGAQYTSAKALINLGWSFKVFVGMISDLFPILGYRRKSYMMIGWAVCGVCLLVLAILDHGEPFNSALPDEDPFNVAVNSKGTRIGLLAALATIGYIFADVPADAMVVEYAQREPEQTRGRMQTLIYGTRTITSLTTTLILGICLNSAKYQGSFDWDMGLNNFFTMLCVPAFLAVPVTYFFIVDPKRVAVQWSSYRDQFWALVQKRCVWQLMLFNFFFNLTAFNCTTTAANYVQNEWAKVQNVNSSIMTAIGSLVFATILAVMGKWGTMWNWRVWLVATTLGTSAIDAIVQYLTIYDVVRDQWFYLGVPLVENVPQAVQFIITTFAIVEVADVGNEGMIYGLLTSCSNMSGPFGAMITNLYSDHLRIRARDIVRDDQDARDQVAISYGIYYSFTVFATCLVVFYPTQKKMLHEWKQDGGKYPTVGACVLIGAFFTLATAVTSNILSMFQSTKCLRFAGGHGCEN